MNRRGAGDTEQETQDRDCYRTCLEIYGDPTMAQQALAEIWFWKANGSLPEGSVFVQSIEVVNGSLLIVHRDPGLAQ